MDGFFDVGAEVRKAMEDALRKRGRANVLIAGRTGVGKSTLINAVFQGNLATTGQGRSVTQSTREVTKEGMPLSIFDTRGLELADFHATRDELESFVCARRNESDPARHIHVAWVCVAEDSRRVEDAEIALVSVFGKYMPVIAVITKARADQGFRAEVQRLLPAARNVVRVRALAERLDDGHEMRPEGLQDLVDLTMEVIPEGQRNAFAAAQKVDISKKQSRSQVAVGVAAAAAAAAGFAPIPFSDAFALVPIQIAMLATITGVFGVSVDRGFLATLLASVTGGSVATLTGRAIVGGLLKLVPGLGTVAGGTIAGATASALTVAFGEAYIASLAVLFARNDGEPPSQDEILATFREQLTMRRQPDALRTGEEA